VPPNPAAKTIFNWNGFFAGGGELGSFKYFGSATYVSNMSFFGRPIFLEPIFNLPKIIFKILLNQSWVFIKVGFRPQIINEILEAPQNPLEALQSKIVLAGGAPPTVAQA